MASQDSSDIILFYTYIAAIFYIYIAVICAISGLGYILVGAVKNFGIDSWPDPPPACVFILKEQKAVVGAVWLRD